MEISCWRFGAPFGDGIQLHSSWILYKQLINNWAVGEKQTESFRPKEKVFTFEIIRLF